MLVASWHLNVNLLHPETLFVPRHPLLLILLPLLFSSMMIKPDRTFQKTFLNEAFIRNAKSFCRTSPTLTYPLSFTVGVGSYCVTSQSLVHLFGTSFCYSRSRYTHCGHSRYCIWGAPCPEGKASWLPRLWSSEDCVLLIGVIISSPLVWPLLKALGFLIWSWLLFCILFLTITLLLSPVLDFCFLFYSISL